MCARSRRVCRQDRASRGHGPGRERGSDRRRPVTPTRPNADHRRLGPGRPSVQSQTRAPRACTGCLRPQRTAPLRGWRQRSGSSTSCRRATEADVTTRFAAAPSGCDASTRDASRRTWCGIFVAISPAPQRRQAPRMRRPSQLSTAAVPRPLLRRTVHAHTSGPSRPFVGSRSLQGRKRRAAVDGTRPRSEHPSLRAHRAHARTAP